MTRLEDITMMSQMIQTLAEADPMELMEFMDWCVDVGDMEGYRAVQQEILRRLEK